MEPEKILDKQYTYAIIGASEDEKKYGHKVFLDLKNAGYTTVPINPKGGKILGEKVYEHIAEAPEVDVAVFVVPPAVTEKVLVECKEKGIMKAWLQPGAASEKALDYCKENTMQCVHDMCIMIEKKRK